MALPYAGTQAPADVRDLTMYFRGYCAYDGGHPCYYRWAWGQGPGLSYHWTPWEGPIHSGREVYRQQSFGNFRWQIRYRFELSNSEGQHQGEWEYVWPTPPTQEPPGSPFLCGLFGHSWDEYDYHWFVKTDVMCHLFMRVSNNPEKWKKGFHIKRGIVQHHDPTIFFPWYMELDQEEQGDTRYHHFTVPFGAPKVWKYWYCWGTRFRKESPSVSPFYRTVSPEAPPLFIKDTWEGDFDGEWYSGWYFRTKYWLAQTFTASQSYDMVLLELYARKNELDNLFRVSIQTVDGAGRPSGTILWYKDVYFVVEDDHRWWPIKVDPPLPITNGVQYAIVTENLSPIPRFFDFLMWVLSLYNPYPGGQGWTTTDPSVGWYAPHAGSDFWFKTYRL